MRLPGGSASRIPPSRAGPGFCLGVIVANGKGLLDKCGGSPKEARQSERRARGSGRPQDAEPRNRGRPDRPLARRKTAAE